MSKKYNLGKSSDMKKLMRDMEKDLQRQTRNSINDLTFDAECPNCNSEIQAKSGKNLCPSCREYFDLNLDINF